MNKNTILIEFASKIKNRRYELGLTQKQLAEKCSIQVQYISGLERAIKNPSLTTLIKLTEVLQIGINDLIK